VEPNLFPIRLVPLGRSKTLSNSLGTFGKKRNPFQFAWHLWEEAKIYYIFAPQRQSLWTFSTSYEKWIEKKIDYFITQYNKNTTIKCKRKVIIIN
jgi:hypothetical protein